MNDYAFGNKILELRTQLNLSQTELAEMLGVTNKAVSKWETGKSKPTTNESMKDVHHRMPLILEQDEVKVWICDDGKLSQFLKKRPGQLRKRMEYEQQRLMF